MSHHLARYDAVKLARVLLREVSIVHQLERYQLLHSMSKHLTQQYDARNVRCNGRRAD